MSEHSGSLIRDAVVADGASNTAKVFMCWSGTRSLTVVNKFKTFLEKVVPELKQQVFVSTQLEKGVRWFEEIVRELEGAQAGILCLTAENLTSPWLHFEAGALAKGLRMSQNSVSYQGNLLQNRIFTYLHGVTASNLTGPLAQYQSTSTTREDTWSLIKALVGVLFPDKESDKTWSKAFETEWPAFEKDLKGIAVPFQKLLPQFERWFQRKTFDEPLQQCTNQDWPGRYDGARQTRDRLSQHIDMVRKACPRYQVDLYEKLLAVVDSYAMDIRGLLFKAQAFELNDSGQLEIKPKGILRACENRRGEIKALLRRILDPLAVSTTEEAAVFWLADSFEQRKLIVHRLQNDVLARRNRMSQLQHKARPEITESGQEEGGLFQKPYVEAKRLFESIWNLDRIFGYLATEYLSLADVGLPPGDAVDSLREAAVMEIERYQAKDEGASLMPTHYVLDALKACIGKDETPEIGEREAGAVDKLLKQIEGLIESSKPDRNEPGLKYLIEHSKPDRNESKLDKRGQMRRTIREIRSLLNRGETHET